VDIYRNTIVGRINFVSSPDAEDGPFRFRYNVILNDDQDGAYPYVSFQEGYEDLSVIEMPDLPAEDGNLKGDRESGYVDADGRLVGDYRADYLGWLGHEIP
jgi:hypothetical protein